MIPIAAQEISDESPSQARSIALCTRLGVAAGLGRSPVVSVSVIVARRPRRMSLVRWTRSELRRARSLASWISI